MSEHDDDGSALTLPLLLLLPPPPPQPAARSASVAVTPTSGANETHFFTCPPRSLDAVCASTDARSTARRVAKYRATGPHIASRLGGRRSRRVTGAKADRARLAIQFEPPGPSVSSVDARPQIVDGPAMR